MGHSKGLIMKQALIKGAKSDEVLGLLNRIEQI